MGLDLDPIKVRLREMCAVQDDEQSDQQDVLDAAAPLVYQDVPALIREVERLRVELAKAEDH